FMDWDAVVSWNRWAVDWASDQFPRVTWMYPQLMPSVWSIIYLFIDTTHLQFFSKAIMAWLPLLVLLLFADMTIEDGLLTGVIAAWASGMMLTNIGHWALNGYAEVPSGVMGFIAFYAAWLSARRPGNRAEWLALIGAVVAAGAMLTKQSGVFFALCYPLFLWMLSP